MEKEKENTGKEDIPLNEDIIFSLEESFPDIENIFTGSEKLDVYDKDTLVFLDTNVLLLAYDSKLQEQGLNVIKDLYEKINKEKRLYISDRVAREFMRNKNHRLANLIESLENKFKEIKNITKIPKMFENEKQYNELKTINKEINKMVEKYKSKYEEINKNLDVWTYKDPIALMYGEIFNIDNMVILNMDDKKEIIKEWDFRRKSKIPPGYNDSNKNDTGIGDFLIWKSMIQLSKEKNKNVVFVTAEQKNDWCNLYSKKPFAMRAELVNEFKYHTGRNINMINLNTFLSMNKIKKEVVEEVREIEELEEVKMKINSLSDLFSINFKSQFDTMSENISNHVKEQINKTHLKDINTPSLSSLFYEIQDLKFKNKD